MPLRPGFSGVTRRSRPAWCETRLTRSYQTQADDIVGKMTIALPDREMVVFANRSRRAQSCEDPVGPRSGSANSAFVSELPRFGGGSLLSGSYR